MRLTGETVKSAIAKKIRSEFATDSYPTIYKERSVQGMEKPCFFICVLETTQEKRMQESYRRTYRMNIRYHPNNGPRIREELGEVENRLLGVLASLPLELSTGSFVVRGKQMEGKIVENVLQVFVSYTINYTLKSVHAQTMERVEIEERKY